MVAGPSESGTPVPHGTGVLGRVTDETGRPVPMATLTAAPEPAGSGPVRQEANVTDEHGDYFLPLPPGRWTVTVTAHGRPSVSRLVLVPAAGRAVHHVTLR
jgi:Carboxypeptidase regulatory-like domain